MRLAGTCSKYSKSAMPQLASAATYHGFEARFFKCAYHANVIKTLDAASSNVVLRTADMQHPHTSTRRKTGGDCERSKRNTKSKRSTCVHSSKSSSGAQSHAGSKNFR